MTNSSRSVSPRITALYRPPFALSPSILTLVAEISECIGQVRAATDSATLLRLRRINRIRTIHSTLAIEGNRLTQEQITAILEGKRVLAPPREVQEVRNALLAYERFQSWTPSDEDHLLEAHRLLMTALVDYPGAYRSGGVGVMAGETLIHMAPPADRVPLLMRDLLRWLGRSADHALISSCVFHYELEFIHPFADGNGRMGRLWQTLILSRWRGLFADLPIETLVHANQEAYYQAIADSTEAGSATPFIEFMLGVIRAALAELASAPPDESFVEAATEQGTEQVTEQVRRLLAALGDDTCPAKELMARLGLAHRPTFLYDYLRPALVGGWLAMTDPDHPRSPRQCYRRTAGGRRLATSRPQETRTP